MGEEAEKTRQEDFSWWRSETCGQSLGGALWMPHATAGAMEIYQLGVALSFDAAGGSVTPLPSVPCIPGMA
jgi:hypothetical protein